MNIGNKPTVSNSKETHIEVHFFNLSANLYNQKIKVELLDYLRKEIKFSNIESLKKQLKIDESNAKEHIFLLSEK